VTSAQALKLPAVFPCTLNVTIFSLGVVVTRSAELAVGKLPVALPACV
jgi:hypothetical protein